MVERLLKAMREARPRTVRQFFALANQHMRWELNDLARRLDEQPDAVELREGLVPAAAEQRLRPSARTRRRILEAIEDLPEDEREVFDLVRIQGLTQPEAAEVLGVSAKTVQRRLNRGLLLLSQRLDDLRPDGEPSGPVGDERRPRDARRPARAAAASRRCWTRAAAPKRSAATCPSCCPRSARAGGRFRAVEARIGELFPEPGSAGTTRRPRCPADDLPRLPGYELIGVLGRGGMGVVYKAVHLRLNRTVALKMLLAGAFATPAERQRFAREAEAGGGAAAPEHRAGLRRRRPRRPAVLHHGVRRGGQPGRA